MSLLVNCTNISKSKSFPHPTKKVRLDVFIREQFPNRSRSEIAEAIRSGTITINHKQTKPSYILKPNDHINGVFSHTKPLPTLTPRIDIPLDIISETNDFLIINKPAGIQVHPSETQREYTIANALIAHYPKILNVGEDPLRPGIVHRLDKDTSGLLLVAKTQQTFFECKQMFKKRAVEKTYLTIVYNSVQPESGIIDFSIARSQSFRKQVVVRNHTTHKGTARIAITQYETKRHFSIKNNPYSILLVQPKTGRMHQIRVHLSAIGHPVVGDTLYARKEFRNAPKTSRQLLHASKLVFSLLGKRYEFESPLPKDFSDFLDKATD